MTKVIEGENVKMMYDEEGMLAFIRGPAPSIWSFAVSPSAGIKGLNLRVALELTPGSLFPFYP
jgi:hypothetical protein